MRGTGREAEEQAEANELERVLGIQRERRVAGGMSRERERRDLWRESRVKGSRSHSLWYLKPGLTMGEAANCVLTRCSPTVGRSLPYIY